MRGRRERSSEEVDGEEGGREVVRKWMERNERGGLRGRRERGSEEKGQEGGRWVVRRRARRERSREEEGGREVVKRRMERNEGEEPLKALSGEIY